MNYIMSKIWSNPTWAFFHTFAEKVDESFYNRNRDICLQIIKTICNILPCPICRVHATNYMKKIKIQQLRTKNDFRMMLFKFHNQVNRRLRKPSFNAKDLGKYKVYAIKNSINLMHYELQRFQKGSGLFAINLTRPDLTMLDNIKTSIHKYERFFR